MPHLSPMLRKLQKVTSNPVQPTRTPASDGNLAHRPTACIRQSELLFRGNCCGSFLISLTGMPRMTTMQLHAGMLRSWITTMILGKAAFSGETSNPRPGCKMIAQSPSEYKCILSENCSPGQHLGIRLNIHIRDSDTAKQIKCFRCISAWTGLCSACVCVVAGSARLSNSSLLIRSAAWQTLSRCRSTQRRRQQ